MLPRLDWSRPAFVTVTCSALAAPSGCTRLLDLTQPRFKDNVLMGKPHHRTTATQAACLFEVLGPEKAKEYYRALKANGVQLGPGNKHVAEWLPATADGSLPVLHRPRAGRAQQEALMKGRDLEDGQFLDDISRSHPLG
jgi:hypothetical protein